METLYDLEVRVDSFINSDLRTHIGRRLADGGLSSSGDIGTDREDSPLQSKRSSTFVDQFKTQTISCCYFAKILLSHLTHCMFDNKRL